MQFSGGKSAWKSDRFWTWREKTQDKHKTRTGQAQDKRKTREDKHKTRVAHVSGEKSDKFWRGKHKTNTRQAQDKRKTREDKHTFLLEEKAMMRTRNVQQDLILAMMRITRARTSTEFRVQSLFEPTKRQTD